MYNNLILLFSWFLCSLAISNEQRNITALAKDPHWLKLLHYTSPLFQSPKSDIASSKYFLSPDGKTNPEAELRETIMGLTSSKEIYCRYPSRRSWLEKKGFTFPSHKCEAFLEWTRGDSVKSISLIFASGFLGNPASYFGHPLLKFNFKDEKSPLDLMDTAINYGAFTPPDVGALPYAILGIFGGYSAGFTSADFFFHRNNYSELELRDLWEYELSFSREQVDELVAHLWELKEAKITYYFFDDNCAYRMSELLELVVDEQLVSKNAPFAIPSTLFHKIYEYSLIKDIKLLKSRQTRLKEKVVTLNSKEREHLKKISRDVGHVQSSDFTSLSIMERSKILETSLDYFSFRQIGNDELDSLKAARRKILLERVKLPPQKTNWKTLEQEPPHKAQRPILTQLSFFHSETFGDGGSFRLRPVFYDLISPDAARPPYSSLTLLDTELNITEEKFWLKSFNLISVESLNISHTGLAGDGGFAWRFKMGADQQNLACNTCTVPRVEFGGGKAFEVSKSLIFYAMIDPRIQSSYLGSGIGSLTPSVSTLITLSDDFRVNAVAARRYYLKAGNDSEKIYLVEGRIGSSRTWDMRLSFQEHIDRRYTLGLGLYW